MGWKEKTEQIVVQIRQWLDYMESKAENYLWLKIVLILIRIRDFIAAVFIISMAVEVALPGINGLMNRYSQVPSLHKEYLNFAEGLYSQGRYSLSYEFAKMAYEIDSSDGECAELLDKAEVACRQFYQEEKTVDAAGIARILSSGKGEVDYGYKQKIVHSSYDEPSANNNAPRTSLP